MLNTFKGLFAKTYYPLNKILLSSKNLLANYQYLSSLNQKIRVAPVLKSNAYGHGIVNIAKILDSQGCPFFCVDSLYEAYELLNAKINTPILIMGYVNPENLKVKKLPFSYAAYDFNLLKIMSEYQKGAPVHIKVDTGMHRLGVPIDELESFLKKAIKLKNIQIVGLMSHLASGDKPSDGQTQKQIKNFQKAKEIFSSFNIKPKWIHLASTDGLASLNKQLSNFSNASRVGLGIYGVYPKDRHLKPVLELRSQLVQVKSLPKGDKVGYLGTFVAKTDMLLGILPIGYNDGVDRRLSNIGSVLIKNKKCRIIGKVSMNITTIDLTGVKNPKIGQEVTVFSNDPGDPNSIEKSASLCKTIPYDLLVHLSPVSIKRETI